MSSPVAVGADAGEARRESEIARLAAFITIECDENADIAAAQKADGLFREGKIAEAEQWLSVFRRLAIPRGSA
jgi:hypothetical protein